jgi:hypothetical protein
MSYSIVARLALAAIFLVEACVVASVIVQLFGVAYSPG